MNTSHSSSSLSLTGPTRNRSLRTQSKPYARAAAPSKGHGDALDRVRDSTSASAPGLRRSESVPSGGTFGWLRRLLPFGGAGAAGAAEGAKDGDDDEEFGNPSPAESDEEVQRGKGTKRGATSPVKVREDTQDLRAGSPFKRPRRVSPERERETSRGPKTLSLNYSRPLGRGWNDPPPSAFAFSASRSGSVLGHGRGGGLAALAGSGPGEMGGLRRSETMGNLAMGSGPRASPARSSMGRYAGGSMARGSSLAREYDARPLTSASPFAAAHPRLPPPSSPRTGRTPGSGTYRARPERLESPTPAPAPAHEPKSADSDRSEGLEAQQQRARAGTVGLGSSMRGMTVTGTGRAGSVLRETPFHSPAAFAPTSNEDLDAMESRHQTYSNDILAALKQMGAPASAGPVPSFSSRTLRRAADIHVPAPSPVRLTATSSGSVLGKSASRSRLGEDISSASASPAPGASASVGPYPRAGRKKLDLKGKQPERSAPDAHREEGEKDKPERSRATQQDSEKKSQVVNGVEKPKEQPAADIPSFLLQEPTKPMKPLPVSLSPSAKNLAPRTGRGSSALRHGSVKQLGQGRQRAVALSSNTERSGKFGLSEDDLDEIEQYSKEAESAQPQSSAGQGAAVTHSTSLPSTATAPSSFTIRKDPPRSPDKPASPSTPNKGAQRGLLGVASHAPRASSPLAQQPPVTASPDSSVGAPSPTVSSKTPQAPTFSFAKPSAEAAPADKPPPPKNPFAGFGQSAVTDSSNLFSATKPADRANGTSNSGALPAAANPFASSSQSECNSLFGSSGSGFKFDAKPASEKQTATAAAPNQPSTSPFTFGAPKAAGPSSSAATAPSPSSPFSFGQPSVASSSTSSNAFGSASNGAAPSVSKPESAGAFWSKEAAQPVTATQPDLSKPPAGNPLLNGGATLGSSTPNLFSAAPKPPAPFTFGAPAASAAASSNASAGPAPAASPFSFDAPANGSAKPAPAAVFNFGSTNASPSTSLFGNVSTAAPASNGFNFTASAPASPSVGPTSNPFGSTSNPFGAPMSNAAPPAPASNPFGPPMTSPAFTFGAPAAGPSFGQPATGRQGSVGPSEAGSVGGTPPPVFSLGSSSGGPPGAGSSPARKVRGMPRRAPVAR